MTDFIDNIPWLIVIVGCLTLGLAPFTPPHLYEKLVMLFNGELKKAIDWGDMLMHAIPWVFLILKTVVHFKK